MDNIVMIMFGCLICTMTGLNFMELRRIRKRLERGGIADKASGAS
jgi:hypothetical protein